MVFNGYILVGAFKSFCFVLLPPTSRKNMGQLPYEKDFNAVSIRRFPDEFNLRIIMLQRLSLQLSFYAFLYTCIISFQRR